MSSISKIKAAKVREALGNRPLLTRYAPSPTGYLHLGHVVNAIWVWGLARGLGGRVILRMEDHDRGRCRPEYEQGILEVLDWLGLEPDLGLPGEFAAGETQWRQSDSGAVYAAALADLDARGLVFGCDCSRRTLQERLGATAEGQEICYDGHCRERGLGLEGDVAVRLRLPGAELRFEDLAQGWQQQRPASQCGDLVLRDRNGNWTYQFCVVVDDMRQGVTLVLRGMDLLSSTGRQLLLADLLGEGMEMAYLHHGLLVDGEGRKLSKRDFAADVHARMRAGEPAGEVLGEAAWRAGLLPKPQKIHAADFAGLILE